MTPEHYAATVRRQVGDRYVLGAEASPTNPDPHVFDCSELVEWSYAQAGVSIRDLAAWQYIDTIPVTDAPRIGDLVFLANNSTRPNNIGHVGIYVGDGQIVEAKGSAYGVVLSSLTTWEAKSTYAGMRRYPAFTAAMQGGEDVKVIEGAPGRVWRLVRGDDHRWRSDTAGINAAIAADFGFEDKAFELHGSIPVHSLTSPAGTSLLTTDPAEVAALVAERWTDDGVIGGAGVGGVPVYRLAKGLYHMHTADPAERAALLKSDWADEGVGFYTGVPAPSGSEPVIAAKAARYDVIASITAEPL